MVVVRLAAPSGEGKGISPRKMSIVSMYLCACVRGGVLCVCDMFIRRRVGSGEEAWCRGRGEGRCGACGVAWNRSPLHRVSFPSPRTETQSAYRDTQTLVKHALDLFDLRTFDDTKDSLQRHLDAMIL